MAPPARIRINAQFPFPSLVTSPGPITITKNNGVWTLGLPVFGPSGTAHASGAVPDPGATAGVTHFLREDGTWALPAGGGGTPGGSSGQLQWNSANTFAGVAGSSVDANGSLTLGGATVTASDPVLNLSQTWNNAAVTFTGIKANVTNTASAALSATGPGSLLLDLQTGGTSVLNVNYNGILSAGSASNGALSVSLGGIIIGRFDNNFNGPGAVGGTAFIGINGVTGVNIASSCSYSWGPGLNNLHNTADTFLFRDAAAIIAQRNLANAQGFRVYNTTDSGIVNYERAVFDWTTNANTLTIGMQAGGTGSARNITIVGPNGGGGLFINCGGGGGNGVQFQNNGTSMFGFRTAGYNGLTVAGTGMTLEFTNGGSIGGATPGDLVLSRVAPLVFGIGGSNPGTVGDRTGWINYAGQTRVTADFSVTSSTALTNVTGLSVNVQAGRTYQFEAVLLCTDAAAGGVQAAIAGTATATNIIYEGYTLDANTVKGQTQATALATAVGSTTTTGTTPSVRIQGTITVNVAGTLTVQMAQNTSNATPTVAKRGSYFIVQDMP